MALLQPDLMLRRVTDLTLQLLEEWGVRALILDVDNTLTTHDNPLPDPEVLLWLAEMRDRGILLMILSNNNPGRVRPFAESLGLPFTADAAKPLTGGYRRAVEELGVAKREAATVGDQIFTDILGGNRFGIKTVLVEPMEPEAGVFFRLKRRLELPVIRRYRKNEKQKMERTRE